MSAPVDVRLTIGRARYEDGPRLVVRDPWSGEELAHVVTPAKLLHLWRWAVIGLTLVAAIFTPSSDPFSMMALALPLIVFYFVAIGIGKLLGR